ncbi:transcriptional regulator, TetR family [Saccharopolyspora shandongensis]|uniref:Transcriptional regulator, TetR family n=1 Tax=Saccharopolyspora shandongensis TaxID=418495 RepID=A0A1H3HC06_9PSEU|nr:TetR family transcriptional regulator [Saccharopolyspora shandongensis]SDY12947.1 transcriptional regulator, TetR family [Saccharopolyspora shandongensis]
MSAPSRPVSLRERKKLRTRQAMIDTALAKFTEQGFDATTVDELCEAVEVSKTTFFRYFGCKEDVVLAPTEDLWTEFLADLETREPDDRPLLEVAQDAVLASLRRMPDDGWAERVRLSRSLAAAKPSIDAHGLQFCARTTRSAMETLHRRFGLPDQADVRARLVMDLLVAAFHRALEMWLAREDSHTRDDLVDCARRAFAAIPGALTLSPSEWHS